MRTKTVILTILLLTVALLFTACAQPVSQTVVQEVVVTATPEPEIEMEPITLTVWDFKSAEPNFSVYSNWVVEKFQEKYPHVTVEIVPQPNTEYYNLIGTAIAADEGPDVVLMHGGTRLTERQDVMIALDDYIGEEADQFINLHNGWTNTESGDIVALPITIQGFIYYYNKTLYEEAGLDPEKPPETWEELVANCEQIMANTDAKCFATGGKDGHGIRFYGSLYAAAIFTPEDHARFRAVEMPYDDPKMQKQLELWYESSRLDWWQDAVASETTYQDSHDNFKAARVAHTQGADPDVSHWKAFGDFIGANNLGMFKNVVVDPAVYASPDDIPIAAGGGIGWSVPRWTEHPDEAADLVKFMTSPEAQLVLFNAAASIIPRKDIDPGMISNPQAKQIMEWLNDAEMPTFYITPTDLNAEWQRQASLLLLDATTPEEATQAMIDFYNNR